ncbi:MAG TPA: GNAT family protein [Candidatus Limnocylindrales bacterium]|nr:GNAT family protein [Candidatus Limnocylindrales bacterium]
MVAIPQIEPVELEGAHVRLEPLAPGHLPGLVAAGQDERIWRWMPLDGSTPAGMAAIVEGALAAEAAGSELPFVTVERATGRVVGSTRYLALAPAHLRLEIGWTWIDPRFQRSAVNTEAKLLGLGHAFDTLGLRRVEFKTDALNEQSRAAILGIGAQYEGIFRKHMVMPGGRARDSAYYSVIDTEWPDVRAHLQARLARHSTKEGSQ